MFGYWRDLVLESVTERSGDREDMSVKFDVSDYNNKWMWLISLKVKRINKEIPSTWLAKI